MRVRRVTYAGGAGGSEVVCLTIESGGHTWPGGPQYLPAFIVGKTCRDFDGAEEIWRFFDAHPRRGPATGPPREQ